MWIVAPTQLEGEEALAAKRVVSPALQVAQLLDLLSRGERQVLQEALRAFRVSHPDYPLPEALAKFEASGR
jgi:hypothetical protein